MRYKIKEIDVESEKNIVIGMIVSDRFIQEVQPILKLKYIKNPFIKIVIQWCNDYYKKYKKAPSNTIQDIYEHKIEDIEHTEGELIADLLHNLSDLYDNQDTFNTPYILDKAEKYLKIQSMKHLIKDLKLCISTKQIREAEAYIANFKRIERPQSEGVNPFNSGVIQNAFSKNNEDVLFKMPGAMGNMIGDFERGQLWAIVGSAKRGKSWHLMEVALRALYARYKVLFISLEMSEKKMVQRIHANINGSPTKKKYEKCLIPVFDCLYNQIGDCGFKKRKNKIILIDSSDDEKPDFDDIDNYTTCTLCRGTKKFIPTVWYKKTNKKHIQAKRAKKKAKIIERSMLRNNKFHLVEFPSESLTMENLSSYIDNLEYYDNFIPDVIITDYADKFKYDKYSEERSGLTSIWSAHKAISQKRHCLMFTASQSNTARTGKKIGQGDWADDIRKLNLVDGAWALNQTDNEKNEGIMYISMLAQRDDDFNSNKEAMVLQQLKIGKPYLDSELIYI